MKFPATITLSSGQLIISKSLTIAGPGPGLITISGNGINRIFQVSAPSEAEAISVSLSGLTIRDGNAGVDYGGGLSNGNAILSLFEIRFVGNRAWLGGGMQNTGKATLSGVDFVDNVADFDGLGRGGGLSSLEGVVVLEDVSFEGNYASDYGGGLAIFTGDATLENVAFRSNSADQQGGGMWLNEGNQVSLVSVVFEGNSAFYHGGGLYAGSQAALRDVTFTENTAGNGGGLGVLTAT